MNDTSTEGCEATPIYPDMVFLVICCNALGLMYSCNEISAKHILVPQIQYIVDM